MQYTIRYKGRTFEEGKKINFIDEINARYMYLSTHSGIVDNLVVLT